MPKRIQRRRTKGWRMPEGAIYVGRPTRWGNPFDWRKCSPDAGPRAWARGAAVDLFRDHLRRQLRRDASREMLAELRGHDLVCWCPLDQPCHADVLIELANA